MKIRVSRSISSKLRICDRGRKVYSRRRLRRHAVRAAEVAPVGHRDPYIAEGAAEGIAELVQ